MRRKEKESKIEPINVLVKEGLSKSYEYKPFRVTALRYKQKTKPDLITDDGKTLNRYWIRDILLDTPETRSALIKAQEIATQIAELQLKTTSIMSISSRVDMEFLHERIIV